MKSLKYIIFFLLILIIGACIYVAVQPNNFEVVKSRTIEAPAAVIYNEVIDYKTWKDWTAWIEQKPDTKITYPDQTKGVGGHYSWEDDDGMGSMKTIAATPYSSIEQSMQFDDFEPSNVNWDFKQTDDGKTNVTWSIKSDKVPFALKFYAAISGGFDKMMGPDLERGLEKLDSLVVESTKKIRHNR
jgi:hypothetical protein